MTKDNKKVDNEEYIFEDNDAVKTILRRKKCLYCKKYYNSVPDKCIDCGRPLVKLNKKIFKYSQYKVDVNNDMDEFNFINSESTTQENEQKEIPQNEKNISSETKIPNNNTNNTNVIKRLLLSITLISILFVGIFIYHNNDEEKVFITTLGSKYHEKWCDTIETSKKIKLTREEAKKIGRTPCSVCTPDK